MDTFLPSSFGAFVMRLFRGLFTAPSWQTFSLLACGWALASGRHTITTYLWVTGAATVKHFSRFYVFLGCPFYDARWQVWACIIRHVASCIPADAPMVVEFDDTTKKKAGLHIEGVDRYRNGAGSARQEYRTLRGLNFVLGVIRVPLPLWPGPCVTVPIGLELYLQEAQARRYNLPYHSRRALARSILDFVAAQLPGRPIRALADGGYATKEFLRDLPAAVDVVSRFLISGQLYALPTLASGKRRGRRPQKGRLIGSPKTWGCTQRGWRPHPTEVGAEVHVWVGLWHSVLPGRLVRVVVIRRPLAHRPQHPGQHQSPPPLEAFFTTALALGVEALLRQYRDRWAIEIAMRDSNAFDGLGHDQCRKVRRMVGAHTLRLVMAAARTLWFIEHTTRTPLSLRCYRPWYRQKHAPSQLDIASVCREALHEAGVFPIRRFVQALVENQHEPPGTRPLAA